MRIASARRIRHSRRVRGRTSKLVLAAGAIVLLAMAVGLVQLTRSAFQAPPPPPASRAASLAGAEQAAPAPATASPSTASQPHPAAAAQRHAATPTRQPELAPAPSGFARSELKRDADGHLVPIIGYQELRAQLHLTDAAMRSCIEQSGQRPTGKATLGFTVAARAGKLVIETTSIEDQDTLGAYPELLDCMHRTAVALAPVLEGKPIPELGTPIYVRRHVRLEAGALAENAFYNFSYNP
jgi:hypothetical protein